MWVSAWLTFFPEPTWRSHPQPIFTQNGSNDVDSHKDVPFALKSKIFVPPAPRAPKMSKFVKILDLEIFYLRSILPLTLRVWGRNTPYSSSESNESAIVNMQCGGEKLKYVPKFWIGGAGHVIWRMRNDYLHYGKALWSRISRKCLKIEAWFQ